MRSAGSEIAAPSEQLLCASCGSQQHNVCLKLEKRKRLSRNCTFRNLSNFLTAMVLLLSPSPVGGSQRLERIPNFQGGAFEVQLMFNLRKGLLR